MLVCCLRAGNLRVHLSGNKVDMVDWSVSCGFHCLIAGPCDLGNAKIFVMLSNINLCEAVPQ